MGTARRTCCPRVMNQDTPQYFYIFLKSPLDPLKIHPSDFSVFQADSGGSIGACAGHILVKDFPDWEQLFIRKHTFRFSLPWLLSRQLPRKLPGYLP